MESYESSFSNQKMRLILATHNSHKTEEISVLLSPVGVEMFSLKDINYHKEIEETGKTLEENATLKALTISAVVDDYVLADDSGIEVDSLNGAPGVYSARFAGLPSDSNRNIDLLLEKLTLDSDRSAQFRTVLVLALKEEVIATFEGVVRGKIAYQRSGSKGFGYDPVFVPDGYKISFAEMTGREKNNISHRAKALDRFITWLKLKSQ